MANRKNQISEQVRNRARNRDRLQAPELAAISPYSDVPIERQVYDTLRRSLMRGELAPGTKISSRSVADALGTSAMPVREALKRLEADNVLESQAKRGFVVRSMTESEFQEILQIRLELEGMAIRTAANQMTASRISSLHRLEKTMHAEQDVRTILDLNYQFHFTIYRAAKMPITLSIIENIWLRLGPALWNMVDDYANNDADENHLKIIKSLEKGDADAAVEALCADMIDGAAAMGYVSDVETRKQLRKIVMTIRSAA